MSSEAQIHEAVCNYIRLQYPNVLFNSDMSGIKLTMGQAVRAAKLRSNSGFPDIVIYEPNGLWFGLFIELKKDEECLYNKNGTIKKTEHLDKQKEVIKSLNLSGYKAVFACGYDEAKKIIDDYLKIR